MAVIIVTPALVVGMLVGLAVSLFQTITALQEQTLSIVPKMLAVVATLMILLPWILDALRTFASRLIGNLESYGPPPPAF